MAENSWANFFRVFDYAFRDGPLEKSDSRKFRGAGISQPDAMPDIRGNQDGMGGSTSVRLRDTNDFVDWSTITNRIHRYKEYNRLRSMAEIEMAMTVFADETCLAGDTRIPCPAHDGGEKTIQWLAENMANERFLVYCYDFEKNDYALGWAFNPRLVKEAPTIRVVLDDGSYFIATVDHRILLRDSSWKPAGLINPGDELMPFYRLPARHEFTNSKIQQFPRIYTHTKGWIHERQFVDEWRLGRDIAEYEELNMFCRMVADGLSVRQIKAHTGRDFSTTKKRIEKAGFSNKELKWLGKKSDRRRVLSVSPWDTIPVYDLSVEKHENFCTNWGVVHNCQKDENGRVFQVSVKNQDVKEEIEFLLFHRRMLSLDQKKMWRRAKDLFINGDDFWEVVIDPDNPKNGVVDLQFLPCETMYRIETTKGRLVEFQQSKEGPDYNSLGKVEVSKASDSDLQQSTAIRFSPEQIIHFKIGDERREFYPYGVSLMEAARGPAHQLRLMEDAMVVYRLCLVGNTRVRTSLGYKYLKDIETGDEVFSFTPMGDLVRTKVSAFVDNGRQEVFRVRTRHVELTGTKTHPVLVSRDGMVQYVDLGDLKTGKDKLILLPRSDAVEYKIPRMKDELEESLNLPEFVDDDFARLFGFLCGRGSIHNGRQLSFGNHDDEAVNQRYSSLLTKYFGEVGFDHDSRQHTVDSEAACRILTMMGYIGNHAINRIPDWVFSAPASMRRAFILGLSDAKGTLRRTVADNWFSRIELSNDRLIEDVKEVWSSIGLVSGHLKERHRDEITSSYSVTISEQELSEHESVLNVTPVGIENVYDITVENVNHNFIANGVPVHNTRAPERRVFYIDVQQLPPFKAEALVQRMKDQFKKKKVPRGGLDGASGVEERWHAPAADEDYWIPIRPNANTRVETLPGAQNLGEIDDTVYFRNKLFIALNFPENYLGNADPQINRTSLSSQDIKFARMIERLQSHIEDGIWELCDRHLRLRGYPPETYEDLEIKMTPPSDWRELTRMEVVSGRIQNAGSLKGSQLMSDFDILTKWMKYGEDESKVMLARLKIQKLEELKLQIIAQNPQLLGVGLPGDDEDQVGVEAGEGNPMLGGDPSAQETDESPDPGMGAQNPAGVPPEPTAPTQSRIMLPEPSEDDIDKYDLDIKDYASEQDDEEWIEDGD